MSVKKIIPKGKTQKNIIMNSVTREKMINKIKYNYSLFNNFNKIKAVIAKIKWRYKYPYIDDINYFNISSNCFISDIDPTEPNLTKLGFDSSSGYISHRFSINGFVDKSGFSIINPDLKNTIEISIDKVVEEELDYNTVRTTEVHYSDYHELDFEQEYSLVILFTRAKNIPLVRIYEGDVNKDCLLDFDDTDSDNLVINFYNKPVNISVDEHKTIQAPANIKPMDYIEKSKDVMQYLDHENFEYDSNTGNSVYENDLGIKAIITRESGEDYIAYKHSYLYKDFLFDCIVDRFDNGSKIPNVAYNLYNESSLLKEDCKKVRYNKYKDRIETILSKYEEFTFNLEDLDDLSCYVDYFESLSFEEGIAKVRKFIIKGHTNNINIIIAIYNDSYIYIKYDSIDNSFSQIILYDLDKNIKVFESSTTISNNANITHVRDYYCNNNGFKFINTIQYDSEGIKNLNYSGPELRISILYDNIYNENRAIVAFDSLIYNPNDSELFVRDKFGVPYLIP